MDALRDKLFEDMPEEERIAEFVQAFPSLDTACGNAELFEWHHRLTGSCLQGREQFCRDHGLSHTEGKTTVREFIRLTQDAYGGGTIHRLKETYLEETK